MVTSRQLTFSSTRRDAWVEVDLAAIEHNVGVVTSWLGRSTSTDPAQSIRATQLMAVVKSDAYGHGAAGVTEVLVGAGAQWLAVASIDEGCQLRGIDSKVPILLLSPVPVWAIQTAMENNLDLSTTSLSQIHEIAAEAARKSTTIKIHLKFDTGMHRLGMTPALVSQALDAIEQSQHLRLISVFSHLAKAEDSEATSYQNAQFEQIIATVKEREPRMRAKGILAKNEAVLFHLASSDAARRFPFSRHDLVRVGLLLYGLEPDTPSEIVIPSMSVRARINQTQIIEPGESVGYGWTWTAERTTRVACVPVGYADGVDRRLSNKMAGLLMGEQIRQVGRISMDQMLFDITDVPQARDGDVITLIGTDSGKTIHLASWARMLDTITYELACRMRVRLPRIYTRRNIATAL